MNNDDNIHKRKAQKVIMKKDIEKVLNQFELEGVQLSLYLSVPIQFQKLPQTELFLTSQAFGEGLIVYWLIPEFQIINQTNREKVKCILFL